MKTKLICAAFVAALMSTAATTALAADAGKVGAAVGKPLSDAQKAMQAKDYQGALADVQQAQAVPNQTPYETYVTNKFLAVVEINLQDMKAATPAAEAAADSPAIPDEDKKDMLHNALLLAGNAQDYAKVVSYGVQLDQLNLLDADSTAQLAVAYYNLKDKANATKYAQKSIDMSKAAGKQANEAAMEIVMSTQAASDQGAAEATLEQIVQTYNRPDDWDQLVGVSLGTKGLSNADALNMYRLLYIQGPMKTGDDYTYMGNLAEAQRDSVEARNVLQAGVSSGKITTAQAGSALGKSRGEAAGDEKIISQAIAAADKSKKGEDGMQIAQDLWGYGRYADVESIATAAKAKGGIKDPGEADVLIGMAQVAQGKYDQGIATLAAVNGNAARMRTAHLWTIYAQIKKSGTVAH
jgi:hypothetical protein